MSYLPALDPPEFQYYLDNDVFIRTNQHLYFRVLFHSLMSFSPHINNMAKNAIKSLNFVRRNLNKCDELVKCVAYLSLVRLKLEYASSMWDQHLSKDIQTIEKVQRIATRWVITGKTVCLVYFLSYSGQQYTFKDRSHDSQSYVYQGLHNLIIVLEIYYSHHHHYHSLN